MLLPHKYQVASVCLSVTSLLCCSYNKTESQPQEAHLAVSTLVYLNIPLCLQQHWRVCNHEDKTRISGVLRSFQTFLKATLPSNGNYTNTTQTIRLEVSLGFIWLGDSSKAYNKWWVETDRVLCTAQQWQELWHMTLQFQRLSTIVPRPWLAEPFLWSLSENPYRIKGDYKICCLNFGENINQSVT